MVIRMPYGGGVHGALYHSQSNEAYFTSTVGLKVVAPGTPADAKGLLKASIRDGDPVMFFEHKKTYRLFKAEVPDGDTVVPIGKAAVAREGKDLSIFCYGFMRTCALEAAETLAREDGVEAEVVDLRTLRPLDVETILASVAKTGKALVVHEANRFGGFGAEIAAEISEKGFEHLDGPVTRLAGPEVPGRAVPPHPRGLVHDRPGADRGRRPQAGRLLSGCVRRRIGHNQQRTPRDDASARKASNRWQPRSRCPSWASRSPKARSSAGWSRKATPSSSTTHSSRSSPTR